MPEEITDSLSSDEDRILYKETGVASLDAKVPKFLFWTYLILPIWGLLALYYFWNGSQGWFDRGYWHQLQVAANTTFPIENQNNREDIKH